MHPFAWQVWWGDMEAWRYETLNGQAATSSGVVPCVAGTCAPAARLTWTHLALIYARRGQDFDRWFSFWHACAEEICGPKKHHHYHVYI